VESTIVPQLGQGGQDTCGDRGVEGIGPHAVGEQDYNGHRVDEKVNGICRNLAD